MSDPVQFYIATALERAMDHRRLAQHLQKYFGWVLTYDWTEHGSVQNQGAERMGEVAAREAAAVARADVVIVLLPGGRGTHTELGMAIALGKPVLLVGDADDRKGGSDGRECAFYHAPGVKQVHRYDPAVYLWLKQWEYLWRRAGRSMVNWS